MDYIFKGKSARHFVVPSGSLSSLLVYSCRRRTLPTLSELRQMLPSRSRPTDHWPKDWAEQTILHRPDGSQCGMGCRLLHFIPGQVSRRYIIDSG